MSLARLYRSILQLHRHLPTPTLRLLGDEYVKNEFKLHWKTANDTQMAEFVKSWTAYRDLLREQIVAGNRNVGRDLDESSAPLSPEQQIDMQKMREALGLSNVKEP